MSGLDYYVKVLINFADHNFHTSQKLNSQTGFEVGGFDRVISYSPKDIDLPFFSKHIKILLNERGAGYWLWKPYIIYKVLKDVKESDYVFYADTGSFFVHSIGPIIDVANRCEQDVIVFENRRLGENGRRDRRYRDVLGWCVQPYVNTTFFEKLVGSFGNG